MLSNEPTDSALYRERVRNSSHHAFPNKLLLSFFLSSFFFKVIPCYTFLVREDAFIIYLLVVLHNVCDLSYPVGAKSLQWSPPPTL